MNDMTIEEFCDITGMLEQWPPITQELDRWGTKYFLSQKAHVLVWFAGQPENEHSAQKVYNRINNPGMLIWLAEVLNIPREKIEEATTAAIEAEKINYRGRCTAFRKVIPFSMIEEAAKHPGKWRYDPTLKEFFTVGDDGAWQFIEEKADEWDEAITAQTRQK